MTWRLYGSLPASYFDHVRSRKNLSDSEKFLSAEKLLDHPSFGPTWLEDPRIANCVVEAIHRGAGKLSHYDLHSFAVMANHAHLLIMPKIEVYRLMKALKGTTARAANEFLHRTGLPFWQDESFDHWVRTEAQFARIRKYIEHNPVKAGLVARPEDWPWSGAWHMKP